jgi:hypothetical protein
MKRVNTFVEYTVCKIITESKIFKRYSTGIYSLYSMDFFLKMKQTIDNAKKKQI